VDSQSFDYYNPHCKGTIEYKTFWNAASKWFAKKSKGSALVLLSGNYKTAVYNGSTFYKYELPYININKLNVLLVSSPDSKRYETCATGSSLNELKEYLLTKNIQYECIDNSNELIFYMCFKHPSTQECLSILRNSTEFLTKKFFKFKIIFLIFSTRSLIFR
jgi:hypothetical protein